MLLAWDKVKQSSGLYFIPQEKESMKFVRCPGDRVYRATSWTAALNRLQHIYATFQGKDFHTVDSEVLEMSLQAILKQTFRIASQGDPSPSFTV